MQAYSERNRFLAGKEDGMPTHSPLVRRTFRITIDIDTTIDPEVVVDTEPRTLATPIIEQ